MQRRLFRRAGHWQSGGVLEQFTSVRWALGRTGLRGRQGRERCDKLTSMDVNMCL